MKFACGGVLVNPKGELLLLKLPKYGGYSWPLSERKENDGESLEEAARRAVAEQVGYKAEIITKIPRTFTIEDRQYIYYLMLMHSRTEWAGLLDDVAKWVDWSNIRAFMAENSPGPFGKAAMVIVDSALERNSKKIESFFAGLNSKFEPLAKKTHELILQAAKDALPITHSLEDGKECIQYCSPSYPGLLLLETEKIECILKTSTALDMKQKLGAQGIKVSRKGKWDLLHIDSPEAVLALESRLRPALKSFSKTAAHSTLKDNNLALPLLQLDMKALCQFSRGTTPKPKAIGETFSYRYEEMKKAALASNENLDEFLTRHIAGGMLKKQLKRKYFFWHASQSELIFITACDRYLKAGFGWLRDIPGYYDSGQDYVRSNATPFLYWEGGRLIRTYPAPQVDTRDDFDDSFDPDDFDGLQELDEEISDEQFYVNDFGTVSGIALLPADIEDYRRIAEDKEEYFDYSVVPTIEQTAFKINGKDFTLHHAHFQLRP